MKNFIETPVIILSADEGKLKIYLEKKQDEPYKGYWILPSKILDDQTTLEQNAQIVYQNMTNLDKGIIFQTRAFSDLNRHQARTIAISFTAITEKTLTDMRKGIDTLAFLVKEKFKMDPFTGQVFLFCGGKQDRFKALYWDGQGY